VVRSPAGAGARTSYNGLSALTQNRWVPIDQYQTISQPIIEIG
jgi:hypothetical protein